MLELKPGVTSFSQKRYQIERQNHWEAIAQQKRSYSIFSVYYHAYLNRVYQFHIPTGQRVLELGCGTGDLLAAVKPQKGVGIDFSPTMVAKAQQKYPDLNFTCADVHDLGFLQGSFDVIVLSDLINDLWDIQTVFQQIAPFCTSKTRIIMNFYSRVWQLPILLASRLQLARPNLNQNWLTKDDVENLLRLTEFQVINQWEEILLPVPLFGLERFFNQFLVKLPFFNLWACTNFIVARLDKDPEITNPSVSVIVPTRNEAGNISAIIEEIPEMGDWTELIFVEGGSRDGTRETIRQEISAHPERKCYLLEQTGIGKGQAVRQGFSLAKGQVLMIFDADLTVPPEDLTRFYQALVKGQGEFINGVRLVYPMEKEAMRFFNFLGNKFFSLAFSWILGQSIKDTLCGTKVLWKSDYDLIAANRHYFGDFDPFGDFDLLFGAAKLNLKLVDLPIRYRERTYGRTNISRWKHGWQLLKMVFFAAFKIKLV